MKPRIVISGVNLMDMGPLTIFREAIASLVAERGAEYDIVALVHRKDLFDIPNVTYLEFPDVKSSWLKRLRFEYFDCRRLSRELRPQLWLAMHDITPGVTAGCQAVYCHNPSIFYKFNFREAALDWKFGLFTLFYRFLYRINIRKNRFVIVQQSWMRDIFKSRYSLDCLIVAHPSIKPFAEPLNTLPAPKGSTYRFFYPAFPRTFKNIEVILEAARLLEQLGCDNFEIWLTCNEEMNQYASTLHRQYRDLKCVHWLGPLSREQVFGRYAQADCLLFPSKLETWGMPITEFKTTGKPIIAADLPYAHETIGDYPLAAFFRETDSVELAHLISSASRGEQIFSAATALSIAPPYSRNWEELWSILLPSTGQPSPEAHPS